MRSNIRPRLAGAVLAAGAGLPAASWAGTTGVDSGDTAWLLTSTALVLFMTIPGLALFYAGLVRSRNVLSVLMQCFILVCAVTVLWVTVGYTLAFGAGGIDGFIGGFEKVFLRSVTVDATAGTIPESVFVVFQLTFAAITPALIVGGFAERMNFSAMLIFCLLWTLFAYIPVAHWVWGWRLAGGNGGDGFCRRHRGARECRCGRAGCRSCAGPPARISTDSHVAAQHDPDRNRGRHALGGLVRV